jgi:hypothetical protein
MVTFDASNSHFEYMDVVRHWSPKSEKFAGGDAVVTLLTCEDWKIDETVFYEQYWCAGSRLVTIYHMEMHRDGETMTVPVLANPYVRRMVDSTMFQLRPLPEQAQRVRR